jgi:hypothetical protein
MKVKTTFFRLLLTQEKALIVKKIIHQDPKKFLLDPDPGDKKAPDTRISDPEHLTI